MALAVWVVAPLRAGWHDDEKRARFDRAYLESVCRREAGEWTAQYSLLEFALGIDSTDADALHDMARLNEDLYCDSAAEAFYKRALECLPEGGADMTDERTNVYTGDYAFFLMNTGNVEGAKAAWKRVVAGNQPATREEAYEMLVRCYERLGEADSMLSCLDAWVAVAGEDAPVRLMKVRALERLGRPKEAWKVAETLWENYPTEIYYGTVVGEMMLAAGDTAAALNHLRKLQEIEATNPSVQLLAVHYAQGVRNHEQLLDGIESMILNEEVDEEMRVNLMESVISALGGTDEEGRINEIFLKLMDEPLSSTTFPRMYAFYMSEEDMPLSDFARAMEKWIEVEPEADVTIYRIWLQEAIEREDYATAGEQVKVALEAHPEELTFYYLGGMMLHEQGDDSAGIAFLERGLKYVPEESDGDEVSDFYCSYGDLLQYSGATDKAFEAYDSALLYNPLNILALNNYAYFLSVENIRLDEAMAMSERVLQIEPDNETYIDTYAWILFRKGDYEGAKQQIDEALVRMAVGGEISGTLYEHAGDIYWHLGRKDDAVDFWEKAAKTGEISRALQKKLDGRQYYDEGTAE